MDAYSAVRRWIEGWSRAWPAGDADRLEPLYSADVVFRSHPFRDPQTPAEYARCAFADEDERLVDLRFGEPATGAAGASVEYWAILRRRDGTEATLAGVAVLRFGGDGRVVEQRDYWDIADGRREPNFR